MSSKSDEKNMNTGEPGQRNGSDDQRFPVIGLGASAGGLDALKSFFGAVPEKSGMAFIVVTHMDPDHPSMLPGLLQKETSIPVMEAEDGLQLEPDHVYVIQPDKEIELYKGSIQLLDLSGKPHKLIIDPFFRSLARDRDSYAVAVIMSGAGTDGSQGLREIKSRNGLVLVQSKESAEYTSMSASAIETSMVDMILRPEEMPERLVRFFHRDPVEQDRETRAGDDHPWSRQ